MNDHGEDEDKAVAARIALLRQEHHDIGASIDALVLQPVPDQLLVARLKKKKLALRDQIAMLEDQLTPDIIA